MCELERRGCDKHTHTQIKVALSTALVRGSQGCDFLKTNVKRETTPRCSICSTDKLKQIEQCGSCMVCACVCVCVCVCVTFTPVGLSPPISTNKGVRGASNLARKCGGTRSPSPLSLRISCIACIPSCISRRTATVNGFASGPSFYINLQFLLSIFFYLSKSKQNSP